MTKKEQALILAEVARCKEDFEYFASKYLKIVNKDDKLVPFLLNNAQRRIHSDLEKNSFLTILKSRQMGSSTYIAARFFWEALFKPNTRVAVVAHTLAAVKSIYTIYQRFYSNLPTFLQLETTAASANELAFITGSSIKIGTANSQNFRGSTYSFIHASEAAFWNDMNTTIQSLFQTLSNNPCVIVETTPNGLNDFYLFWSDENAYDKLFLSWTIHEEYRLDKIPHSWKMTDVEKDYISSYTLDEDQINWFIYTLRTKCANNIHTFRQEYPIEASGAFIASGTFVFPQFSKVIVAPPKDFGWKWFIEPNKYRTYVLGVDTASGSPGGDFSAAVLIDITDKEKIGLAATFYDRLSLKDYYEALRPAIEKYQPLIVAERNSYGQAIIEQLKAAEYPYLYTETKFDKMTGVFTDRLGFYTSSATRPVLIAKLISHISNNTISITDKRLQYEFMNFIYNDKGKAEAEKGFHDDMIMALALALMGEEQAYYYIEEKKKALRPTTVKEIIEFEIATGTPLSKMPEDYFHHDPVEEKIFSEF